MTVTVLDEAIVDARPQAAPQLRLLTFTEPLPGFPRHHDYALVPADAGGLL